MLRSPTAPFGSKLPGRSWRRSRPATTAPREFTEPSSEAGVSSSVAAAVLAVGIGVWTVIIFQFDTLPFAVLDPVAYGATEAAGSLGLIFGAVALLLFPDSGSADRMRWVAFGLLVLGVGNIVFNYVFTGSGGPPAVDDRLYASILVRTSATSLMALGIVTARCPRLTVPRALAITTGVATLSVMVLLVSGARPQLIDSSIANLLTLTDYTLLHVLTPWHWLLSAISMILIVLIVFRLIRPPAGTRARTWLVVAMMLLAGSHLHNLLWPSIYSPIVTTADVLSAGFAAIVMFGAYLELRAVALERAAHLAEARRYSQSLVELNQLRADFTRTVVHEIGHPLAAIARLTDILREETAELERPAALIESIQHEAGLLRNLIADVNAAVAIEKDLFRVSPRPVPVQAILDDSLAFARALPELTLAVIGGAGPIRVSVDPDRIGQVIRNLLTNAAEFTPAGTPVTVEATRAGERVRMAVIDAGPGIHPDDQARILEKFGRGRHGVASSRPGLGLGLYVSRRILQLHGSDLRVESTPGSGSTFSFELEVV
jgi:signal transduction histidine kinase